MHTYFPLAILLFSFTMEVWGQQFPGQFPEQHERDAKACQAELFKLRKLTDDQRKYIELLEKKIESLQQQSAMEKENKP